MESLIYNSIKERNKNDNVHRPYHYSSNGLTPIEAFEKGLMSKEETIGFLKGNVIKYVIRFDNKNGLEDLEKAGEYIKLLKEFLYKQ